LGGKIIVIELTAII